MLEIQVLRFHPRPPESEIWGVGCRLSVPVLPPGDAGELKLETRGEHITTHRRITLDTQLYGLEHRLSSLQKVVALFFTDSDGASDSNNTGQCVLVLLGGPVRISLLSTPVLGENHKSLGTCHINLILPDLGGSQHPDLERKPAFPKFCISVECTLVYLTRLILCYEKRSQPEVLRNTLHSLYQFSGSQIHWLTAHFDSKLGVMIFPTNIMKLTIRKS